MYAELGDWIRRCYDPAGAVAALEAEPQQQQDGSWRAELRLSAATAVDRVVLRENQKYGQRVRQYQVEYQAPGSPEWMPFSNGTR